VGILNEHYFTHKPEMWEGTRRWIKLHNEELHDLYSLSGIVKAIRSRRIRWMVYVSQIGENRNAYNFGGEHKRKTHLEDT
jgi:hypothetical protein